MDIELIKDGIVWGIGLSLMTGPILFAILDQSIRHGKRNGLSFSSGIWFSDVLFTTACYFTFDVVSYILTEKVILTYIGPIGVIILFAMGIHQIISGRSDSPSAMDQPVKKGAKRLAWIKGFTMNAFNPFTVLFWIGLVIYYSTGATLNRFDFLLFATSMLITIIALDLAKIALAGAIRKKLRPKNLLMIKVSTGIIFVVSAIVIGVKILIELSKLN